MAANLEITPRVVAFGSRLVQLHQVTSVQLASVSPWRGTGRLLIGLGGAILVAVLAMPRAPAGALGQGLALAGSGIPSVIGLLLLGLGLLAYFFNRDFLVIATADGEKLRINAQDHRFMMDVVDALRAAMSAPGDSDLHYVVDVVDRQIERRRPTMASATSADPPVEVRGDRVAEAKISDTTRPAIAASAADAPVRPAVVAPSTGDRLVVEPRAPAQPVLAAVPEAAPVVMPASKPGASSPSLTPAPAADAPVGAAVQRPLSAAVARTEATRGEGVTAKAAVSMASGTTAAIREDVRATTELATIIPDRGVVRPSIAGDIDGLVGLLRAGDAPHLEQLIQLLDVVKRHATGQPQRMSEARQGWTAFSEYARRYLSGIEGLEPAVARLDAVLLGDGEAIEAAQ